jgi:NAD(P)-dependent dehydrogenase (short-subunit alcohol dehydrogenase family)
LVIHGEELANSRYNSSKKAADRASFLEKTYNVKAKAYQCQITDPKAVRGTVSTIIKEFGKIDSMIVNHGIPSQASILDGSYDDWKKVIDIDLNGSFYVAKVSQFAELEADFRPSGNISENGNQEILFSQRQCLDILPIIPSCRDVITRRRLL